MQRAMAFGGKQFHCKMSCDNELANEWARCSGKHAIYITIEGGKCSILGQLSDAYKVPLVGI